MITRNEFNSLCAMMYIEPLLAIENDKILQALRNGAEIDEITELLESEF